MLYILSTSPLIVRDDDNTTLRVATCEQLLDGLPSITVNAWDGDTFSKVTINTVDEIKTVDHYSHTDTSELTVGSGCKVTHDRRALAKLDEEIAETLDKTKDIGYSREYPISVHDARILAHRVAFFLQGKEEGRCPLFTTGQTNYDIEEYEPDLDTDNHTSSLSWFRDDGENVIDSAYTKRKPLYRLSETCLIEACSQLPDELIRAPIPILCEYVNEIRKLTCGGDNVLLWMQHSVISARIHYRVTSHSNYLAVGTKWAFLPNSMGGRSPFALRQSTHVSKDSNKYSVVGIESERGQVLAGSGLFICIQK